MCGFIEPQRSKGPLTPSDESEKGKCYDRSCQHLLVKTTQTCGLGYYETFAAHRISSLHVQQHLAFNVTNVKFLFRSHLVPLGSHFSNAPITHLATHITT